ncbi:hypothetical protein CDL15_Pgr008252 [Punica granatum]|uniref:Uncharacterized protein n=1 Tax=Punica granatum TaxID=22663 RepID=A0A218VTU6_PUNGR|nr:hypothetical protein CDL15_Pgr008252 [Punica granatum]
MKVLWDELETYLESPICTCGTASISTTQRETEKVFQFLMGLTPEFNTIRFTILTIEPLPNVNKVYHMVARLKEVVPEAVVFSARRAGQWNEQLRNAGNWLGAATGRNELAGKQYELAMEQLLWTSPIKS